MLGDARLRHASYLIAPSGGTTVQSPATGAPLGVVNSAVSQGKTGIVDITQGRITLAALEVIIVAMVLFYWRTHGIQGGG